VDDYRGYIDDAFRSAAPSSRARSVSFCVPTQIVRALRCRRSNIMIEFAIGAGVLTSIFAGAGNLSFYFHPPPRAL
jgi:hypothetical protein